MAKQNVYFYNICIYLIDIPIDKCYYIEINVAVDT